MKKLLFILLACFISVSIVPLGNAGTPDDCQGLRGPEFGLCIAYCQGEECDINPDTAECEDLRTNNERINGYRYFPCDDLIACGICADVVGAGSVGECEEVLPFECVEPSMNIGPYLCDEVFLPADSDNYNSCQISDDNNPFNVHPLCQNSIPAFVCTLFLKGVVLPPNSCPSLPSCIE